MICNLLDHLLGMSCVDHQSRTTIQPNSLSSKIVPRSTWCNICLILMFCTPWHFYASIIVALNQLASWDKTQTSLCWEKPDRSVAQGNARTPFLSSFLNIWQWVWYPCWQNFEKAARSFPFSTFKETSGTMENWYVTGPFSQEYFKPIPLVPG